MKTVTSSEYTKSDAKAPNLCVYYTPHTHTYKVPPNMDLRLSSLPAQSESVFTVISSLFCLKVMLLLTLGLPFKYLPIRLIFPHLR